MYTYVLILIFQGSVSHAEFNSQTACDTAGKEFLKICNESTNSPDNKNANYICTPKE